MNLDAEWNILDFRNYCNFVYSGFLQNFTSLQLRCFLKTKNLVFPFKMTEMGTCLQKHIAFSDYKVIFSSNLTIVNFKGISVDLRAIPVARSALYLFLKAAVTKAWGEFSSLGCAERQSFTNAFVFCHKEI